MPESRQLQSRAAFAAARWHPDGTGARIGQASSRNVIGQVVGDRDRRRLAAADGHDAIRTRGAGSVVRSDRVSSGSFARRCS